MPMEPIDPAPYQILVMDSAVLNPDIKPSPITKTRPGEVALVCGWEPGELRAEISQFPFPLFFP